MPEPAFELDLDWLPTRAKVRLRVGMAIAQTARRQANLPTTFATSVLGDATAVWLGPDQWLLLSDRQTGAQLIAEISAALDGLLHHAVDVTDAFACARLRGAGVRALLSMGSGLDWSSSAFRTGQCRRTRFARIPIVAHAVADAGFDLYYDRSYRSYLERWFAHAAGDPLLAKESCRTSS